MTKVESKPLTRGVVLLAFVLLFARIAIAQPNDQPLPRISEAVLGGLVIPPAPPQSSLWLQSSGTVVPDDPEDVSAIALDEHCWPDPLFGEHESAAPTPLNIFAKSFVDFAEQGSVDGVLRTDDSKAAMNPPPLRKSETGGTDVANVGLQSLFFLGIMHSWRLALEPDTRAALNGKFFPDYWNAITQLRGWTDGDGLLTNYVGHPMMGAISGRILLQNQPGKRELQPSWDSKYVKSRLAAFGYSFAFSLQFEVGLISEGTIGNATPNQYSAHPFSYVDLVITPTLGTAWTVGEDLLDKFLIQKIERHTDNRTAIIAARGLLNPSRAFSNLLRFKKPWYRDDRR